MATTIRRTPETVVTERSEKPGTGAAALVRRHSVLTFYILVFAISWGGVLLTIGPSGMFSTGESMGLVGGAALLAGPSVAGVLLTGLLDGRAGLRQLLSRLRRWRVGARWYGVALLTGPLVISSTLFGLSLVSPEFRSDILTANDKVTIVVTGIVLGLTVGVFEELGWTGYALPRLRRRYGVLTTGLVMGLLWGAWHFPMFAGTRDPEGIVPAVVVVAVFLFAWLPAFRVLMVWVYDRTQSLLVAMLMHAPISITTYILATEATSTAAVLIPALVWGAALWLIVAIVTWANGGHLTRRQDAAAQVEVPVGRGSAARR